jgi:glycosyltransferase involved in cell wall biosynthesis
MMLHLATRLRPEFRSEAALIRDGWLETALRNRGVPVRHLRHRVGSFGKLYDLTTLRDLLSLIQERQVAILHAHEFYMNTLGLAASRLTGVPLVATVHGRNYYADRLRRRLAYRLIGRFAGKMVTVSQNLRHFLVERTGIPPEHIRVVPNGVSVDEAPSRDKISEIRKALELDQQTLVVGTVGRLDPVKGHRYLIDAAVSVIQRCPRAVFLIAGRGENQVELERQARQLGVASQIRFLGHREDVRELLEIYDVFTLPSLSEGMPLALLEAMAAGVPCVASRVGGIGEVIADEETGLLVRPRDSQALARSILWLLNDPTFAKQMGAAGRQFVARRYSVPCMVQAYQDIYEELTSQPAHG